MSGMENLSRANNALVFAEFDHRLGRHKGQPDEGCPKCHPDRFTAATSAPVKEYVSGFTYSGLNPPIDGFGGYIGTTWHEPGVGAWVWTRFNGIEGWQSIYDVPPHVPDSPRYRDNESQNCQPLVPTFHDSVMKMSVQNTISEELLIMKHVPMGVDVMEEVRAQLRASIQRRLMEEKLIQVTGLLYEEEAAPLFGGKKVSIITNAVVQPSFGPHEARHGI